EVLITNAFPGPTFELAYGAEFSPNGQIIYMTVNDGGTQLIYQFDRSAGPGTVAGTLQTYSAPDLGTMRLRNDGKIYMVLLNDPGMSVINDPNSYATPNIVFNAFPFPSGLGDMSLANDFKIFNNAIIPSNIAGPDQVMCSSAQANLGCLGCDSISASYQWEPAALVIDPNNAVTQSTPLVSDQEFVLHTIYCGDTITSDTVMVVISSLTASVTTNAPICQNEALMLSATPTGLGTGNYSWTGPNGALGGVGLATINIIPFLAPIEEGWYYVTLTDGSCPSTDSVFVQVDSVYTLSTNVDICSGSNYTYADGAVSVNVIINESHTSSLTSVAGCDSTITENLNVITASANVPTIFTPESWYCATDNITDVTSDIGDLWYSDATLTVQVGTDTSFTPPPILGTTTYYVIDTTGGCFSLPDSVTVTFENCSYPCPINQLSNGGFETFAPCPTGPSELANATGWENIQGSSNDYFNCTYFGHPSGLTYPGFPNSTDGMFYNPEGSGYAGFIPGGTGFGKEGFGQAVTLKKCIEYTIQFRMAHDNVSGQPDNDICIYGGNSSSATGCMSGFTSLGCISSDSIDLNWRVYTLTFIPTQTYSYIAISGACPTTGTSPTGGYVYIDDVFLCEAPCLATMISGVSVIQLADDSCSLNTGSITADFTINCYTSIAFDWSQGGTTVSTDSIATGLASGLYVLTITDGNACELNTFVSINSTCSSGLSVSNDTTICAGNTVTLYAYGSTSGYTWVDSLVPSVIVGVTDSLVVSPTVTTTYLVYNATDSLYITVFVDSVVAPTVVSDTSYCSSSTLIDLIGLGAGTINWYADAGLITSIGSGASYSPSNTIGSTTYYATQTSALGCVSMADSATITIVAAPNAGTNGATNFCLTDPATDLFPLLGAADVGGAWTPILVSSTGVFDPSIDIAGTYQYIVPGTGGCANDTAEIVVTLSSSISAGNDVTVSLCPAGGTITLTDSITGSLTLGGVWSPALSSGTSIFDPILDLSGVYEYIVGAGGTCGSDTSYVVVNIYATPDPGISGTVNLCNNGSGQDLFLSLGGTPNSGGNWSPTLSSGTGVFNPLIDVAGTYSYTVSSTPNCASASANVVVSISTAPDAGGNGTVSICSNGTAFTFTDSLSGTPDLGGVWTPVISGTLFNPGINSSGTYTYTVSGIGGCLDATASITVSVNAVPGVNLGTTSFCEGDSALIDAGNTGSTYLWNPGGETTQTILVVSAGTYSVDVTSGFGCLGSGSITIIETPLPTHNGMVGNPICLGETAMIVSFGTGILSWNTTNTNDTIFVSPFADTWYYSTYTNSCGSITDSILITVNPTPTIIAGNDTTVAILQDALLWATGGISYVWSPSTGLDCPTCSDPMANLTTSQVYYVIGTDTNGCVASDSVVVTIDGELDLFVPNVFSPNGDNFNDIIYVRGGPFQEFYFAIFNRWGQLVFETSDQTIGWDGTFKANELDPAVFVYKVSFTDWQGESGEKAGNITLVK
ncbi:MAG: gliding motility-associated C-terminal domain-containing protein, partial [Flavobacteriales bacterium]|nr:gliding motility-associated C-terminal domain-containing protein [Flavobacteriales bacterium]